MHCCCLSTGLARLQLRLPLDLFYKITKILNYFRNISIQFKTHWFKNARNNMTAEKNKNALIALLFAIICYKFYLCKPCDSSNNSMVATIMDELNITASKRLYVKDQITLPTILHGDPSCTLTGGLIEKDLIKHSKRKGKMWEALLHSVANEFKDEKNIFKSPESVIIEVGSGYFPKAGLAASEFQGTYILVEPNDDAIKNVVCIHSHVLPKAKVIGLRMDALGLALLNKDVLESELGIKKENIILTVGNHAIDDMILASTFSSVTEAETFFHVLEAEGEDSLRLAKAYWNSLQGTAKLEEAKFEAQMEWQALLNHLPPRFVALSAYRSGSFTRKGLTLPDESAKEVMDNLKREWHYDNDLHDKLVPKTVKDPERWLLRKCIEEGSKLNQCRTIVDIASVVHLFW